MSDTLSRDEDPPLLLGSLHAKRLRLPYWAIRTYIHGDLAADALPTSEYSRLDIPSVPSAVIEQALV